MTISKRMAAALIAGDQYRTKKYLYSLGVNMYGQEIVQRVEIDSEGHRVGLLRSVPLLSGMQAIMNGGWVYENVQ